MNVFAQQEPYYKRHPYLFVGLSFYFEGFTPDVRSRFEKVVKKLGGTIDKEDGTVFAPENYFLQEKNRKRTDLHDVKFVTEAVLNKQLPPNLKDYRFSTKSNSYDSKCLCWFSKNVLETTSCSKYYQENVRCQKCAPTSFNCDNKENHKMFRQQSKEQNTLPNKKVQIKSSVSVKIKKASGHKVLNLLKDRLYTKSLDTNNIENASDHSKTGHDKHANDFDTQKSTRNSKRKAVSSQSPCKKFKNADKRTPPEDQQSGKEDEPNNHTKKVSSSNTLEKEGSLTQFTHLKKSKTSSSTTRNDPILLLDSEEEELPNSEDLSKSSKKTAKSSNHISKWKKNAVKSNDSKGETLSGQSRSNKFKDADARIPPEEPTTSFDFIEDQQSDNEEDTNSHIKKVSHSNTLEKAKASSSVTRNEPILILDSDEEEQSGSKELSKFSKKTAKNSDLMSKWKKTAVKSNDSKGEALPAESRSKKFKSADTRSTSDEIIDLLDYEHAEPSENENDAEQSATPPIKPGMSDLRYLESFGWWTKLPPRAAIRNVFKIEARTRREGGKYRGPTFTNIEMRIMLVYLIKCGLLSAGDSITTWNKCLNDGFMLHRSKEAMRNNFKKVILHKIDTFGLPLEYKNELLQVKERLGV